MRSGKESRKAAERASFALKPNEPLKLHAFVGKSVVEVFANDRPAIGRRVYPTRSDNPGLGLFAKGGGARFKTVEAWDMRPANPC